MFINVIPPEITAQSLRDSIEDLEKMAKLVEIIVMAATKRKYKYTRQII